MRHSAKLLVVLAILLTTAAGAANAHASLFEASSYPAEIYSEQTEPIVFESELGSLECEYFSVEGKLEAAASQVALTPDFKGCKAFGTEATFVNVGECHYIAYPGEEIEEDEFLGGMDIACSEVQGAGFKWHFKAIHCIVTLAAQIGIKDLEFTVHSLLKPVHISVTAKLGSIKASIGDTSPDKCSLGNKKFEFTAKGGLTIKVPGGVSIKIG